MEKFDLLLKTAMGKGYKTPFPDERYRSQRAQIVECAFIYAWMKVKYKSTLDLLFIENIPCDEQIDMMLEEIEKYE